MTLEMTLAAIIARQVFEASPCGLGRFALSKVRMTNSNRSAQAVQLDIELF